MMDGKQGERQEPRGTPENGQVRVRDRLLSVLRWLRRHVQSFYAVAGLFLSAGLVLAMLGLWGLSGLTEGVLAGETLRFDEGVLRWMDARATGWLDVAAIEVTAVGDILVVLTIAVVAGTLLYLLGRSDYAALVAVATGGAGIVNPVLKAIFDRPRPQVFEWRAHQVGSPSFPSGHAAMSMVLFLVLVYIVHRLSQRRWIELLAFVLGGLMILLIGVSRIYLGVHYPSDVLAGYVVGFSWAVFCAVGVELLWHTRRVRAESDGGIYPA